MVEQRCDHLLMLCSLELGFCDKQVPCAGQCMLRGVL